MEVSDPNQVYWTYNIVLPITFKLYSGYNIRVFLSGDRYEFLSALYVLSGAIQVVCFKLTNTIQVTHLNIANQPCLWCLMTLKEVVV